jgi:FkbM family methyltransferase
VGIHAAPCRSGAIGAGRAATRASDDSSDGREVSEITGDWLMQESKRTLGSVLPQSFLNWREAQYYGRYGEVELHLLEHLCDRARDSIDIGANDGSYIHFMRKHSRRVYAFEPLPWLATALKRKFSRGVVINNIALSRSAGMAVLRMPIVDGVLVTGCATISPAAASTYSEHQEIHVPMAPLDAIFTGDAGFIKIDVEGHEEAVLDGARKTLRRCRPRMLVELDERLAPGAIGRVTAFFRAQGYNGHFVFRRQLLPIARFDRELMQRPEDLPDLKARLEQRERFGSYIYNFLFFPADEPNATLCKIGDRIARM